MSDSPRVYEAIIVGGGPAGLSAGLILGRCRRRVIVCDAGRPRNAVSQGLHGFLTRDGILPAALLRLGRRELGLYDVRIVRKAAIGVRRIGVGFEVRLKNGARLRAPMLLLATGVIDELPRLKGLRAFYGRSIFHCPYCDGWEVRDRPLAVYGRGRAGLGLALALTTWSDDVVLCTDGPSRLGHAGIRQLAARRIPIRTEKIDRLEGANGALERIVFASGGLLPRRALFFAAGQLQASELAAHLGCLFTGKGAVRTNRLEGTGIPGLYVAGDASRDVQLAIVAAAEGAKAAFAINTALMEREGKRARAG